MLMNLLMKPVPTPPELFRYARIFRRMYDALLFALLLSTTIAFSQLRRNRKERSMALQREIAIKRTIRRKELRQIVPLADSTIFEMEQRGQFPRRFALTPRCVVWDLAEVETWLTARRATPIQRTPPPDLTKRRSRA